MRLVAHGSAPLRSRRCSSRRAPEGRRDALAVVAARPSSIDFSSRICGGVGRGAVLSREMNQVFGQVREV